MFLKLIWLTSIIVAWLKWMWKSKFLVFLKVWAPHLPSILIEWRCWLLVQFIWEVILNWTYTDTKERTLIIFFKIRWYSVWSGPMISSFLRLKALNMIPFIWEKSLFTLKLLSTGFQSLSLKLLSPCASFMILLLVIDRSIRVSLIILRLKTDFASFRIFFILVC